METASFALSKGYNPTADGGYDVTSEAQVTVLYYGYITPYFFELRLDTGVKKLMIKAYMRLLLW